ncbi:MAG: ornithine decarboxylase, partial [Acidobacteria bacterium]|nr:ornithine decarboxylase [Acidobacteriota bacterium]
MPSLKKSESLKPESFYSVSQYRSALWRHLRSLTRSLTLDPENREVRSELQTYFQDLEDLEKFWAFPGRSVIQTLKDRLRAREFKTLLNDIGLCLRAFSTSIYRKDNQFALFSGKKQSSREPTTITNYFEVLYVDSFLEKDHDPLRESQRNYGQKQTDFFYGTVSATSYEEAITAILFNPLIQSVVIRYQVAPRNKNGPKKPSYTCFLNNLESSVFQVENKDLITVQLAEQIKQLRPELSIYYVTDDSIKDTPEQWLHAFKRIFFRMEDLQELHISILQDIRDRYKTPFYTALKDYSQKPTGVFHAMPISRGNSVFKSWWMRDFGEFYGRNLFLAETSSTSGGLDSLSQPTGPLKKAQEMAAKAYGSEKTYFVTNGTSTSNKIVLQGLVKPGDIVLIDRECHKSHHYALVQSGAIPVYLDSYKIQPFSIYGAVPIATICKRLEELKAAGRLDRVKMLILTNSTFDGIVYNPFRVMSEVLKIKKDLIFLWDEAWFAFASFSPYLRSRTAMNAARRLLEQRKLETSGQVDKTHLSQSRIRVYATQSTHKTLSSFRQGSVIHVLDEDFNMRVENAFHEAYLTHISTSPNYQILASLDAGRCQAEFEGFELTERAIEMAMNLRHKIATVPLLKKYFHVLKIGETIPQTYRPNAHDDFLEPDQNYTRQGKAWSEDEFAMDPTKITLCISNTGVDGNTFRNLHLMEAFGIQVNKTSRNTVLFMTNIGTTRSSVSYLASVLIKIAENLEHQGEMANREEKKAIQ